MSFKKIYVQKLNIDLQEIFTGVSHFPNKGIHTWKSWEIRTCRYTTEWHYIWVVSSDGRAKWCYQEVHRHLRTGGKIIIVIIYFSVQLHHKLSYTNEGHGQNVLFTGTRDVKFTIHLSVVHTYVCRSISCFFIAIPIMLNGKIFQTFSSDFSCSVRIPRWKNG